MFRMFRSVLPAIAAMGAFVFAFFGGIQLARATDGNKDRIGIWFLSPDGARLTLQATYITAVTKTDQGLPVYSSNCFGCSGAPTYPYQRTWTDNMARETTFASMPVPFRYDFLPSTQAKLTIALGDGHMLYGLISISQDKSDYHKFQDYRLEDITPEMVQNILEGQVQTIWLKNPNKEIVVTIQLGTKRPW